MTASEYQDLVEFLGHQFTAIDQRFDTFDRRFDAIDEKFREVFGHFDEIYRRLERLEQEYYAITQSLRRIEGLLADEIGRREVLEWGLEDLKRQIAVLQARIAELEQRIQS